MQANRNPYEKYLEGRDAVEIARQTPDAIRRAWQQLGPGGAERAVAAGKWTAREIFCHLADAELVWGFRLRQALAEAHHVIQPMDQAAWSQQYRAYDTEAAVDTFVALRRWNLALIDHALPGAADKPVTHPERGELTMRVIVETLAGHDVDHLRQLETIAGPLV